MKKSIAFAAFILCVWVVGCGRSAVDPNPIGTGGAAACGPDTCNGCCAQDGSCEAGNAHDACGKDGEQCDACSVGDTCAPDSRTCETSTKRPVSPPTTKGSAKSSAV